MKKCVTCSARPFGNPDCIEAIDHNFCTGVEGVVDDDPIVFMLKVTQTYFDDPQSKEWYSISGGYQPHEALLDECLNTQLEADMTGERDVDFLPVPLYVEDQYYKWVEGGLKVPPTPLYHSTWKTGDDGVPF